MTTPQRLSCVETGEESSFPPTSLVNHFDYRAGMGSLFPPTSPSDQIRTGDQEFPRRVKAYTTKPPLSSGTSKDCARTVSPWSYSQTRGDRKSTRQNSSHLGISYAVFC